MLEKSIQELTLEVRALIQAIKTLDTPKPAGKRPTPSTPPGADETASAPVLEIVAGAIIPKEVTHEELVDLVLKIIRYDRSKQAQVRQIISCYGALTLDGVHVDKLPALKLELEALQ